MYSWQIFQFFLVKMSDNEYEKFEISDYDLDNEFNPNRRRRMTKNQKIYGELWKTIFWTFI